MRDRYTVQNRTLHSEVIVRKLEGHRKTGELRHVVIREAGVRRILPV